MLRQRSEWADLQPDGVTDVGGFCILAAHPSAKNERGRIGHPVSCLVETLKGMGRLAKWLSKNSTPVTSAAKALTNSRAFTVALKVCA